MFNIKIVIFFIINSVTVNCEVDNNLIATIENGKLLGVKRGSYYAFEGIPYAEPPVGVNRFEPPLRYLQHWNDIRNATKPGASCMQWDHYTFSEDRLRGSEDCLFLNVYTLNLKPDEKYPVIVHIHGGAFMYGNGDFYGEEILMHRPIIYVNINYRLGPLGFLSTEDNNVPGNMGLKDQNMALKWIKENIERFGGDPEKITITGYSAGGASVHLHYMSKLSEGLFQNGISHSGCALNPWVFQENALNKAKELAVNINCFNENIIKLINCLKQKPAEDIVRSVKIFQSWLYNPFSPFGVVVEQPSETAFLTETPISILENGKTHKIPWLASATEAEGIYPGGEIMTDEKYLIELNEKWNEIAPALLDYNLTIPDSKKDAASQEIRKYYLKDSSINADTFSKVLKMLTDRLFICGLQNSIKLQAKCSQSPVYFYYFKFSASKGIENVLSQKDDIELGVSHGDDIHLIYDVEFRRKNPLNNDEIIMQNKMLDFYYNYAQYGRLVFDTIELERVNNHSDDENHDENDYHYLEIIDSDNAVIKVTKDLCNQDFWKDYPSY